MENEEELITTVYNDAEDTIDDADKYRFKLENFEGPLDLLLHLIHEAKMDIKNIQISKITEQYLSYLFELKIFELEPTSEFVQTAATLLEIKSRSMLPRLENEDNDELDPEKKLILQLQQYKLFKESAQKLAEIEETDRFYRLPDKSSGEYRFVLGSLTLNGLLDAFSDILIKVEEREEPTQYKKIEKDRFTVAQKIASIKDALIIKKSFYFSELFENDYSKGEIITTFLALLELLKMQIVYAEQDGIYKKIKIISVEEENIDE
ncbi:MAG: segregation/condensation protein A [Clostridia bacterium]|jgi:segregation and condensation protein A|nr:segregation/condensation protein A [Clostridia bacterium]MDD4275979.1 segregation/condensation protein A [Clostridia bacterium]